MPFMMTALALIMAIIAALLFVSIVWTHHPGLSVLSILRDAAIEIKNTITGRKARWKGKSK